MHQDIPKLRHLHHGLRKLIADQPGLIQYLKGICITRRDGQPLVRNDMVGDIHAQLDHELERTLDNSLCLPVCPILLTRDLTILRDLLQVSIEFGKLAENERFIDQSQISQKASFVPESQNRQIGAGLEIRMQSVGSGPYRLKPEQPAGYVRQAITALRLK